jgi:hypothetical protein
MAGQLEKGAVAYLYGLREVYGGVYGICLGTDDRPRAAIRRLE